MFHRAVEELHRVGRLYPHAWRTFDRLRAKRKTLAGGWPDYVFCPLAAAPAIVGEANNGGHYSLEAVRVGALAAWRPTQGIYRYSTTLLDALLDTSVTGDLPVELLHRLPEWCVYLELGREIAGLFVHGVWAHLDYEGYEAMGVAKREELRLLFDTDLMQGTIALPLERSLGDGVYGFLPYAGLGRETRVELSTATGKLPDEAGLGDIFNMLPALPGPSVPLALTSTAKDDALKVVHPIVSALLYLCSEAAEVRDPRDPTRTPKQPGGRVDKHGETRWNAAERATIWETGTRLGAALDRARAAERARREQEGDRHVAPHIRRAHWHTFWVGAHDSPDRQRVLRWLPPIPVNLDDAPDLATIRPVGHPAKR